MSSIIVNFNIKHIVLMAQILCAVLTFIFGYFDEDDVMWSTGTLTIIFGIIYVFL